MRDADYVEITEGSGLSALEVVGQSFDASEAAWTGEWDGEIVCLFGVVPYSVLTGDGCPWLVSTDKILECQKTFLKMNRGYVDRMSLLYSSLYNYVDTRNEVARRWLAWLGFTVNPEPEPFGPNQLPFHYFEMRR
ncbi:MAG: hypothetical protein GY753_09820 [Gammaproteobacteria bacterium]|nr:hypothetical protein [Gammaproteobacteria bacterium]